MSALDSPAALFQALLFRVPLILRTALLHGIGQSPGAGKQDLRTELTVAILRSFITGRKVPVGKQQKGTLRDPGIKGPVWVSKVTIPEPEIDVQDAVVKAIRELQSGGETYDLPGVAPVGAEWTGYRSGVDKNAPEPDISEEEKFQQLKKENDSDMVVLYFHGGAYYLMDPCTHRQATSQLSKRTRSPVLSVRYRLAPQNPFPAALVDALTAYLYLLSPPPGSLHTPYAPHQIIIAGDSAGGNLSLVLLQTLLTLHRTTTTIPFHKTQTPIAPPAGTAVSSPWCDITRSMPSIFANAPFDYLPTPAARYPSATEPFSPPPIPKDEIWPASPPRVDYFVNSETITHPLVSPLAAPSELWKGCPPVFISVGEEGLTDEGLITARKMHRAGVDVVAEQVEGMPHCFALVMPGSVRGRAFYDGMGAFCVQAVRRAAKGVVGGVQNENGSGNEEDVFKQKGKLRYLAFKKENETSIDLGDVLEEISDEEVDGLLGRSKEWRVWGEKVLRGEGGDRERERARL
ncbi:alpha/beta hydrolase fold-domain-containing protein [Aspergillus karnatakaensis]|uniref:alpha/beta hydrolase fold-domain-containing protein n=1 Tax=Aspergillus karnatakaensis TaxID=1810916 RepID=UPI003CCD7A6D